MAVTWEDVIPNKYRAHGIVEFDGALRLWPWGDGKGPLLYGPTGVGKSCAAGAMMMASRIDPYFCRWISLVNLFADMRRRMNGLEVSIPDLSKAQLIVIDDLGKERPTDWAREQTFELVEDLYQREAKLIVTSNIHPANLEHHVGEFVMDRLKDMTTCVALAGESRRG